MGVFFVIPLYRKLVIGLHALEIGIKMLPVPVAMFQTSAIGSRLCNRFPVRAVVRTRFTLHSNAKVIAVEVHLKHC